VQLDGLRVGQSVHLRHFVQVRSELFAIVVFAIAVFAIANWDFHLAGLRKRHVFEPVEVCPQNGFQFAVSQFSPIKNHQQ
jgi:hypothetical protein